MEVRVKWILIFLFMITFFTFWFSIHFEMWYTEDLDPELDDESEIVFDDSADLFDSLQADTLDDLKSTTTDAWFDEFGTTDSYRNGGFNSDGDPPSSTPDIGDWWNKFNDGNGKETGTMETTSSGFDWWDSTSTVTQMSFKARDNMDWLKEVHESLVGKPQGKSASSVSTKAPYDLETTTDWDYDWTTSETTTEFMKATPSPLQGDGADFMDSGANDEVSISASDAQNVVKETPSTSGVQNSAAGLPSISSNTEDSVSNAEYSVPNIENSVPYAENSVSNVENSVPYAGNSVQNTGNALQSIQNTTGYGQNTAFGSPAVNGDIKPIVPGSEPPTYRAIETQYTQKQPNDNQVANSNSYTQNEIDMVSSQVNSNGYAEYENGNAANSGFPTQSINASSSVNNFTRFENESIANRSDTNGVDKETVPIQQMDSSGNSQGMNDGVVGQHTNSGYLGQNTNSGYVEQNTNGGYMGQNTNSGYFGQNTNSGYVGENTNSGYVGQNTNSGYFGENTNSGYVGQNTNSGYFGQNTYSGYITQNENSGYVGQNANSGYVGQTANNGYVGENTYSSFNEQNIESGYVGQKPDGVYQNTNVGNEGQNTNSGYLNQNVKTSYEEQNTNDDYFQQEANSASNYLGQETEKGF